jgi:hypothetical protein
LAGTCFVKSAAVSSRWSSVEKIHDLRGSGLEGTGIDLTFI